MAFDVYEHFQKPYERWLEELSCAPDDLDCFEEKFQKRLEKYREEQRRDRDWKCSYCDVIAQGSYCHNCGAPRE